MKQEWLIDAVHYSGMIEYGNWSGVVFVKNLLTIVQLTDMVFHKAVVTGKVHLTF